MTCGDFWKVLIALWPQANSRVHYCARAYWNGLEAQANPM